jgi:hypothetical protein
LTRDSSSYLDLLTGDMPAALSATNPFVGTRTNNIASTHSSSNSNRLQLQAGRTASGTAGSTAAAGTTDELQRYLQDLGVGPTSSTDSGSFAQPPPQLPQQQQQRYYPVIGQPMPPAQQQQQQQAQQGLAYPSIPHAQSSGSGHPGRQPTALQQQQQQHYPSVQSIDRVSSSSSTSSSALAGRHTLATPAAAAEVGRVGVGGASSAGPSSTGSAAAAAAVTAAAVAAASRAAAAAGDTGSSDDSTTAPCSYTNPFASLDTRSIMKSMRGQGSGNTPTAAAAGASAATAGGVYVDAKSLRRRSTDSSAFEEAVQQQAAHPQQQQQQAGLLLQPLQHAQGHSTHSIDQASPVMSPLAQWPPAPQQQQQQHLHPSHHSGQLQLKVQQLLQSLRAPQHKPCSSCGLPGRYAWVQGLLV